MSLDLPKGFRYASVHCGLKTSAAKPDLSLIVADKPAVAVGVYTQNVVYAAPVAIDRQRTPSENVRGIVINAGNANACTGQRGIDDADQMTRQVAAKCDADAEQVLVMSTGIIGHFLPMEKVTAGIDNAWPRLGDDDESFLAAARGILTTDKSEKIASRTLRIGNHSIRIAGMAKGAGMIGPKMATMLCAVMTDATLTPADAQHALKVAVDDSFNCISVDGHTSTNDTVLLLASGAAGGKPLEGDDLQAFVESLREVCIEIAKMIPDDGEGALHLITIDVTGCASRDDAFQIAQTVAASNLVKTAITGCDPNWGRIVSAAGYSGVCFDPNGLQLALNGVLLYRDGSPVSYDAAAVSGSMRRNREVHIELQLAEGDASARYWASDLTVDYVTFNSEYTT